MLNIFTLPLTFKHPTSLHYSDGPIKLFPDLYLVKFLNILAKSFLAEYVCLIIVIFLGKYREYFSIYLFVKIYCFH